jgi:hypothetical protein
MEVVVQTLAAETPRRVDDERAKRDRERMERESRELVERLEKRATELHETLPNLSVMTLFRLLRAGRQTGRKTPL